jgi:hypothetical protein
MLKRVPAVQPQKAPGIHGTPHGTRGTEGHKRSHKFGHKSSVTLRIKGKLTLPGPGPQSPSTVTTQTRKRNRKPTPDTLFFVATFPRFRCGSRPSRWAQISPRTAHFGEISARCAHPQILNQISRNPGPGQLLCAISVFAADPARPAGPGISDFCLCIKGLNEKVNARANGRRNIGLLNGH